MGIVIGIDVGISTTKIVGIKNGKVSAPIRITARKISARQRDRSQRCGAGDAYGCGCSLYRYAHLWVAYG